jgi:hypothetical protein
MKRLSYCLALLLALAISTPVFAQNVASQKAYFGSSSTEILGPAGDRILHGYIKTSGVGDLLIGVSMECALWTRTITKVTKGGSTATSSSRAAVNVTVKINGNEAVPGQVVYCDREQIVSLTFSSLTVEVTDAITLDLFLKTKNANHFNFYGLNPGSGVHHIEVFADSLVQADANTPSDSTRAVVGKRTLLVEEHNNP